MAEDVVLARFRADLDEVRQEFEAYIKELEKTQAEEKQTQAQTKKTGDQIEQAAKKRTAAIKTEQAELKRLELARRAAFTPEAIDGFNKKITDSKNRIALLRGETETTGSLLKSALGGIFAGIGAAFSIGAVIQWQKAAVNAFIEAEENANKLRFAVQQIGGEGEEAFRGLIEQSSKLQESTIFSDDAIQQAQTALATFGLTSERIKELIPRIADFAAATRTDIVSATDTFIKALEGQSRGLVTAGLKFQDTGTIIGNYNVLMDSTTKLTGAAEEATKTLAGQMQQLENQTGELQERIGKELAPAWVSLRKAIFGATLAVIDYIKTGGLGIKPKTNLTEVEVAYQKVTEAVEGQTKALVEAGFEQNVAQKNAIENLRFELRQRLSLRIEEARRIAQDEKASIEQKRFAVFKVQQVRNELDAVRALADANKAVFNEEARRLSAAELHELSVKRLNELLKENIDLPDAVSKDNVTLINAEIAAREKASKKEAELLLKRREEYEKYIKAIEADSFKATQDEIDNIRKVDAEFFKSLDKRKKQVNDFYAEAEAARQKSFFEEQAKEPESERRRIAEVFTVEIQRDSIAEIKKINEDLTLDWEKKENLKAIASQRATDKIRQVYQLLGIEIEAGFKSRLEIFLDDNEQIIDATTNLVHTLSALYSTLASAQIEKVERSTEAELLALDKVAEANEDQLNKRQISEREFANKQIQIEEEKVRAQEEADKKIRALKRRQAVIEKAAAIIQITVDTARAYAETLGQTGFAGIALGTLVLAAGAAQAAIVAATPIPYEKGTKDAKGGLSLVGERGAELRYLEPKTKIVPADETRKQSALIDAMVDKRTEEYIYKTYVTPELEKQRKESVSTTYFTKRIEESILKTYLMQKEEPARRKAELNLAMEAPAQDVHFKSMITPKLEAERKRFETSKDRNLARNITQSIIVSQGITGNDLETIRKRGQRIINIEELADAIAKRTRVSPYR